MRNRKFIYAALALLTLGFAACQQEEDFAPQEQEIRVAFTTDAIQTRVNTLEGGNVWENGDQVKIERTIKYDSDYYTYTVSVVENGTPIWTLDKKLYWNGEEEHILAAFYPAVGQDDYRSFELPEDQSTLEKLKSADCMNAMWKGTPTTEPINLTLKHRLSMVTVTYTLAEEFEPNVEITPEVYCYTRYIFFNVNTLERQDVAWEEGDDIWVKAYKHEEVDADGNVVAKKFTAIVSPDAYAAGDEFIRVTIGDQVLTAKMQEDITFAEGTHYTFDLKVGKDVLTIEQVSMNDSDSPFGDGWNNEEDLN